MGKTDSYSDQILSKLRRVETLCDETLPILEYEQLKEDIRSTEQTRRNLARLISENGDLDLISTSGNGPNTTRGNGQNKASESKKLIQLLRDWVRVEEELVVTYQKALSVGDLTTKTRNLFQHQLAHSLILFNQLKMIKSSMHYNTAN